MNKAEFIDALALEAGCSKADAMRAIDAYHHIIMAELSKRNDVTFVGFGTYTTVDRAARSGRNPQTGMPITIAAATMPKFRAGKALKKAVNKN